jgi:sarcosine oxidase subunit alpha
MSDRRTPTSLHFTFEGRRVEARPGQTLAGALHARGVRILTRSFKYHRPRGYTCGYGACGNCPLTVDGLPGVNACEQPVVGGEVVRRERGWPTAGFDVLRLADLAAPFLTAGFQFRMFVRQPRLAHLAERVMGKIAGAGRMPTSAAAAAQRAEVVEERRVDVVVVGGGLSGLAAALGAAEEGASVVLVHRGPLGGRALGRVEGTPTRGREFSSDREAATVLAERVGAHPLVEVLDGTGVATFDTVDLVVTAGRRRVHVHAGAMVVATGSYDVPLAFANNDRPGVMLGSAARRLLHVEHVRPGRRAVVVAEDRTGHDIARELQDAGVQVVAVVGDLDGAGADVAPIVRGRLVAVRGVRRARGVVVRSETGTRRLRCDLVVVARAERPAEELRWQRAYVEAGDTHAPRPTSSAPRSTVVVGSAAGVPDQSVDDVTAEGRRAARSARASCDTPAIPKDR